MKTEYLIDSRRDAVWYGYATDVYTDTDVTDKTACLADVFKGWWIDTYPDDDVTGVDWAAIADIYLDSADRELSWTRDHRAYVGMFNVND